MHYTDVLIKFDIENETQQYFEPASWEIKKILPRFFFLPSIKPKKWQANFRLLQK